MYGTARHYIPGLATGGRRGDKKVEVRLATFYYALYRFTTVLKSALTG